MPFGCCFCVFKGHNVLSKLQAHWKTMYRMSQSSNSELLSGVGWLISFKVLNSTNRTFDNNSHSSFLTVPLQLTLLEYLRT